MSNKKQTAVEWLIDKLEKHYVHHDLKNTVVFEQAKTMEKEQMNKMYDHAMLSILDGNGHGQNFEEYYNETYNKTAIDGTN